MYRGCDMHFDGSAGLITVRLIGRLRVRGVEAENLKMNELKMTMGCDERICKVETVV